MGTLRAPKTTTHTQDAHIPPEIVLSRIHKRSVGADANLASKQVAKHLCRFQKSAYLETRTSRDKRSQAIQEGGRQVYIELYS